MTPAEEGYELFKCSEQELGLIMPSVCTLHSTLGNIKNGQRRSTMPRTSTSPENPNLDVDNDIGYEEAFKFTAKSAPPATASNEFLTAN